MSHWSTMPGLAKFLIVDRCRPGLALESQLRTARPVSSDVTSLEKPIMGLTVRRGEVRGPRPQYDVVIAGASFAGLAVAQQLGRPQIETSGARLARVALLDPKPVGDGVTSACAAPLAIVHAMGAGDSIRQTHDQLVIHTPSSRAVWSLPEPFCTFDYWQFCKLAFERAGVDFIQAHVIGRSGSTVRTTSGEVPGTFLVDATGWRAALVGGPASAYVNRRWMAFGIESEVACEFNPGLHFYFLPEVRDGYAWAFPAGGRVRCGVLSYLGRSKLSAALEQFMGRFGLRPAAVHGGFLASGLRSPVVDGVFVAGDASGQCLPLSGEGIRTAILAGFKCGESLLSILEGRRSFQQAAEDYALWVRSSRLTFHALLLGNLGLLALPRASVGAWATLLARPRALQFFMRRYLGIFLSSPLSFGLSAQPQFPKS